MRLLLALLFAAFVCTATPTTITDTLLQPYNNLPAAGVDISVTQAAFFSGSTYYPAWSLSPHPATDANGLFSFALEPNPAGQLYVVTMKQSNGVITSSCWNVPASGSPVNIQTVLSTTCGTPPLSIVQLGQLAQGGAIQGNVVTWNNTLKRWEADAGGVTASQVQQNMTSCFDSNAADTGAFAHPYLCNTTPSFTPTGGTVVWLSVTTGNAGPFLKVNGGALQSIVAADGTNLPNNWLSSSADGLRVFYALRYSDISSTWVLGDTPGFAVGGADALTDDNCIVIVEAALPGQVFCSPATSNASTGAIGTPDITVSSLTTHGVMIGEGPSPVAAALPGTAGWVLTSNGPNADPTMQAAPSGGGSLNFQSFILVDGGAANGWTAMAFNNGSAALGVTTAAGPLSASQSIGALLLAPSVTNLVMVTTKYEAAGTVDIGWVTVNREGASGGGQWNFSVYLGCAANDSNFTYGTASTLSVTPTSTAGLISNYRVTAVNVPAACGAHKPMQVWIFRTADTGGSTGLNVGMVSIDVTQH